MNFNVFLVIVATVLFQGGQAETTNEVIAILTSQIVSVKTNIDINIQNDGNLIRQTRKTIGQTITEGETTVQDQLDQLDSLITQAELEGQEKGVDVSKCVQDVSVGLSNLNFERFQSCAKNINLDLLGKEFENLRIIKRDLSNSINRCLPLNLQDPEGLRVCVQADIDAAKVKIQEVQQKVQNVCEEAVTSASACVESAVSDLDRVISDVAHSFKNCLLGIL